MAIDGALTSALDMARLRVNRGPVTPSFDRAAFREELAKFDFATPVPLSAVLDWTVEQMLFGLTHVAHPRYFGLFNPTPSFPSQCADRIAAVFNPQLATHTTSPAAVEIEAHVIRAVGHRLGLPAAAGGHFTTGGAEANNTALLLALTRACPAYASEGLRAFDGQPMFYISRDSHLAWLKIAHQAGIGRDAVRLVATDGHGRMEIGALADAIETDRRSGRVPVMVVATFGTTNAGMIDPVQSCVEIANRFGAWLHVDAAWGGGVAASDDPQARRLVDGLRAADSVTVDAHKWFATTMGCGMLLTPHVGLLRKTFHVSASYMPSDLADDPYASSLQWSRRFLGLRLFLSLATVGWEGHGAHVDRTLALSKQLRERSGLDWRVVNDSPLGVVCLLPPAGVQARAVVNQILANGQAWVSVAAFEGREVVRACVTSGDTVEADIDLLVDLLRRAASQE